MESRRPIRSPSVWRLYSTSFSMLLISLLVVPFCYRFNDPPSLLSGPDDECIDCYSFRIQNITTHPFRVDFELTIGPFVEFPREAALPMLHLVTVNGQVITRYSHHTFALVAQSGSRISFTHHHCIGGVTEIILYCRGHIIVRFSYSVERLGGIATG
jgi:hypothetical protein